MADRQQGSRRYWLNLAWFALAALLGGALALVVGLSAWWAHNYTHPVRHPIEHTPSDYGLAYESVAFSSTDGLSLAGWFILPQGKSANGGAIVLCHGYGATRATLLPVAGVLARHGYHVLAFDFRGHGESGGELVTLGYDEVKDVQGAVAYLRARLEVAPDRIGVLGQSMGAATAIRATAQTPEIGAVVAESAYASLVDLVANDFSTLTGLPRFPFAPLMTALGEWQTGLDMDLVRPVDDISQISPRPVFIIHGLGDTVIRPESGVRLYEAAREPKWLWQPEGIGHVTAVYKEPTEFEARVISFFDQA
ncbi:MAG: alpha/beta fold hydrolase, partial [Anaerolineae bacterium]